MPIYEYKCKACDEHFEVEQSITEESLTTLPGCEATDDGDHVLKKVFSAIGISFKGEGFYKNDSRQSSKPSKAKAESSSSADSSNGSSDSPSSSSSSSSSDKGSSDSSSSKTTSSSTGSGASSSD